MNDNDVDRAWVDARARAAKKAQQWYDALCVSDPMLSGGVYELVSCVDHLLAMGFLTGILLGRSQQMAEAYPEAVADSLQKIMAKSVADGIHLSGTVFSTMAISVDGEDE